MARLIREAVDAYLTHDQGDAETALEETFGVLPDLKLPSRDEWDRDSDPRTAVPVDTKIVERGGRLRRSDGPRLPDALIAASALEHRLTLVTQNVRDFEGIRGLKLRAPA